MLRHNRGRSARVLPLCDRLRIAAVDLAVTGAPRELVAVMWVASEILEPARARSAGGPR